MYQDWFGLFRRLYDSLGELFIERAQICKAFDLGGVGRLENL